MPYAKLKEVLASEENYNVEQAVGEQAMVRSENLIAEAAQAVEDASSNALTRLLGHWAFSGERRAFLFDKTCAALMGIEDHHQWIEVEKIFEFLSDKDAARFHINMTQDILGDMIYERCTFIAGPLKGQTVIIQGSILDRDEEKRALYATGYVSHELSPHSELIPRELSGDGMYYWDAETEEIVCSASMHAMLGYREDDFPHLTREYYQKLVHTDDIDFFVVLNQIRSSPQYGDYFEACMRLRHKEGHYIWSVCRGLVQERDEQGRALKIIGSHTNINLVKSSFDNIRLMMFNDSLTGLRNRSYFQQNAPRYEEASAQPVSVIFVDVSGLKLTNDILGHSYGDYLLIRTRDMLREAIASSSYGATLPPSFASTIPEEVLPDDQHIEQHDAELNEEEDNGLLQILRLGGDEFLVMLPNCSKDQVQDITEHLERIRVKNNNHHAKFTPIEKRPTPICFGVGSATYYGSKQDLKESEQDAPVFESLKDAIDRADELMQLNKDGNRARDYGELKLFFEAKKGRPVSMRDERRVTIMSEEEREELRKRRINNLMV